MTAINTNVISIILGVIALMIAVIASILLYKSTIGWDGRDSDETRGRQVVISFALYMCASAICGLIKTFLNF